MFGFGGHPGHQQQAESDETELYDLLGVSKSATAQEIKKAFRKKAMKLHPDRAGGDAEAFKKVNKAHEVLSDPQKRELYDRYGMEGLENGGGGGGGAADIFEMFGMGGGGRRRPTGPRKGESITFPLKVTLAELYNGQQKKLRLTKSKLCGGCDGKGGKGEPQVCSTCHGRGVRIVVRQLGPGMLQQLQTQCNDCSGQGSVVSEEDRCKQCEGRKVTKVKKTLEVHINRGAKHGERIIFRGEADEAPGTVPGDVIVVLQQVEDEFFTRRGPDLFIKHELSLNEALTGFAFTIKHLDDRTLVVRSQPGEIVKPGEVKSIADEGFPDVRNQFSRGNLYVEFDVVFPASGELQENTVKLLRRVLPDAPMDLEGLPEEHEDVQLQEVDLEQERRRFEQQRQREAYEDDGDDEHGPQMGGCRQA